MVPDKGLFYFAHPYTGDHEGNFRLCNARAAKLLQAGYNVFSPISHSHPIQQACAEELPWYEIDFQVIDLTMFSGIILAPGWERSKGCCAEKAMFDGLGLPSLYYDRLF